MILSARSLKSVPESTSAFSTADLSANSTYAKLARAGRQGRGRRCAWRELHAANLVALPLRVSEFVCNDGHTLHSAARAEKGAQLLARRLKIDILDKHGPLVPCCFLLL